MRTARPGGILNALATALHGLIRAAISIHHLRLGLLVRSIRSPSFRLSVSVLAQQSAFAFGVLSDLYAFHNSTVPLPLPYSSLGVSTASPVQGDLTTDLKSHLQTLYAQSFRRSCLSYRGCWHRVSRCLFLGYRHCCFSGEAFCLHAALHCAD